jgi:DNA-formamidopyrimidine glycosylase
MPEGPEVTIISENLNSILSGFVIYDIEITPTSRYRNKVPDNFSLFKDSLPLRVKEIKNKGKLIYFEFQKSFFMLNTLGMSGIWRKKKDKHTSIIFTYGSGEVRQKLYFTDQRHFGTVKFLKSRKDLNDKLKTIGPDMLNDPKMSFKVFRSRLLKYPKQNIVKVLMDQKIVSGVGNYLKSESLYHARISPFRNVSELSELEMKKLYQSVRTKILGSYHQGGVSVKDFKDVDDKKGLYQFEFEVYCKKTDKHGNKVVKVVLADKRSTYYVPELQF